MKEERQLCACGKCGEYAKLGNKYLNGHNGRGKVYNVGQVPWNKGETKETDPRIAKLAKNLSEFQKKKLAEDETYRTWFHEMIRSEEKNKKVSDKLTGRKVVYTGWPIWSTGLTKETDSRLAELGKKVSVSSKGKPKTQEHRNNMSKAKKGSNHPMYGKHPTEEARRRMSGHRPDFTGENNPMYGKFGPAHHNWRGGKNLYCQIWSDEDYRQYILERDGHKCNNPLCRSHNPYDLVRHHINHDTLDCRPENIIVVCRSCNGRANAKRWFWKKFYQNIMIERGLAKTTAS